MGNDQTPRGREATPPSPDMEPDTCNAPLGAQEVEGRDTRACIHVHSVRKRLADPDGISAKAVIDGIVKAGLLENDTTKDIKEITFSQEKGDPEETIITIEWR